MVAGQGQGGAGLSLTTQIICASGRVVSFLCLLSNSSDSVGHSGPTVTVRMPVASLPLLYREEVRQSWVISAVWQCQCQ